MRAGRPVSQFINRLSESSRDLWHRQFGEKEQSTIALCQRLLTLRGEASGILIADEIIERLSDQSDEERLNFYRYLLAEMQPDQSKLKTAAEAYIEEPGPERAAALAAASKAPRKTLFRMLATSPRGAHALVEFRAKLRKALPSHPELKPVDYDLVDMFRSWFSRGFLELREISWTTPAHILEKLIAYEAVHEIRGWDDLRRRLASDRRCYGFFHPALRDEPLIFVEVALLKDMASNIDDVIRKDPGADMATPQTAIFYSISNCQPGLAGVSFGNFLIKQVVKVLQAELPELRRFATLSPVPGFRKWLDSTIATGELAADLEDEASLLQLCAHYLIHEKHGDLPLDPVARFHLGNGARLERLNLNGDMSERGVSESYGMLVNYVYDLPKLERNHEALVNDGTVATTQQITKFANAAAGFRTNEQSEVSA